MVSRKSGTLASPLRFDRRKNAFETAGGTEDACDAVEDAQVGMIEGVVAFQRSVAGILGYPWSEFSDGMDLPWRLGVRQEASYFMARPVPAERASPAAGRNQAEPWIGPSAGFSVFRCEFGFAGSRLLNLVSAVLRLPPCVPPRGGVLPWAEC